MVDASRVSEEPRQKWTGKLDFVLSCISFAVGFGNIWRFPYMCYKNGGAVFLIPYLLMLATVGFPLFYMELCLGQFSGKGPMKVWGIVPIIKGVGYAMVLNSFFKASYYVILVAYTFYYFFASMSSELPWNRCALGSNSWANPNCYSSLDDNNCKIPSSNLTYWNNECQNITALNSSKYLKHTTPGEDYFNNNVLQLSPNTEGINSLSWQLSLCLLLSWIVIYFCMIKGTKSFGKVSCFTAIFPYIIMTILLVKGATLPGSSKGVLFYIIPDFSKLMDVKVWFDAASQIFYSLGCGIGCLITFASFNDFNKKNKIDSIVIAGVNSFTSLYAGFAIFSILGFLAEETGLEVEHVATDGSGLVFIAYPQALSKMPLSPFWSIIFFTMLLTLGVGSLFGPVEVVMTAIQDLFPSLRSRKPLLLAVVILTLYLIGLIMLTNVGPYIFTVLNAYNGYSMVIVGLFELIAVSYIYGFNRFIKDIEFMTGSKLGIYWKVTWGFTAPIFTLVVVVVKFIHYKPPSYGGENLPPWINDFGWVILIAANGFIPLFMIIEIYKKTVGWKSLVKPEDDWYPSKLEFNSNTKMDQVKTEKS